MRDPALLEDMEKTCVEECRKIAAVADYIAAGKGTIKRFLGKTPARLLGASDPGIAHPVPMAVVPPIARGEFMVLHEVPTLILLLVDRHGVGIPEMEIGIVGTNVVMAAESDRLGPCSVGVSRLLNRSQAWWERLGVDDRFEVSEALAT